MKSKWFRWFLRECGDTSVGIVNAENEEEAKQICKQRLRCIDANGIKVEEIKLENGFFEIYYG